MENKKKKKKFDAVRMMRKIRDKISRETKNMSHVEFSNYVKKRLGKRETVA